MISEREAPVSKIIREDEALVIVWEDGAESVFSHAWLRENAPENRFLALGRSAAPHHAYRDVYSPWSVSIEYDETLVISWAGLREVNRFSLLTLKNSLPDVESAELALSAD
ncbi:MAG: DUF971 domain-containing protein [Chloroflexi bacterium]|nr:DUF971 domain-containing protein [Chloroflexota bacterium]